MRTDQMSPAASALHRRFIANVRRLREERGLTREAFAAMADLSGTPVTVGRIMSYEQGHREPLLSGLADIAHVLGVDPVLLLAPVDEVGAVA